MGFLKLVNFYQVLQQTRRVKKSYLYVHAIFVRIRNMTIQPDSHFTGGRFLRDIDRSLFGAHRGEGGWRNFVWGNLHGLEHVRRSVVDLNRAELGRACDHFRQAWSGEGCHWSRSAFGRGEKAYNTRDGYQGDVRRAADNLGGIDLGAELSMDDSVESQMQSLMFSLHSLEKASLKQGELVLMGLKAPIVASVSVADITQDDILLALLCVYSGIDPSFSLDPWESTNPDGPYYQKVFYPDALVGTALGETLFETDYIMKKLALGEGVAVSGLCNEAQISLSSPMRSNTSERARLWISAEDVPLSLVDGVIHFGAVKMVCSARRLVVNPNAPSGLSDALTQEETSSTMFAREFTEKYLTIAKTFPPFERLRNLAKLVALAKFMCRANVPINTSSIKALLATRGISISSGDLTAIGPHAQTGEPRVHGVPRLSKTHTGHNHSITLSGGVVLAPSSSSSVDLSFKTKTPSLSSASFSLAPLQSPVTSYARLPFSRVAMWRDLPLMAPEVFFPVAGVP
jgi:hypothetical protein